MLQDMFSKSKVRSNTHAERVQKFRKEIGEDAYLEIANWWLDHFEQKDWVGTSWEAKQDWSGTPLDVIWQQLAYIPDQKERHNQSAILYGCICYTILFDQPDLYEFYRPEGHHKDDPRPFGLVYRRQA